MLDRASLSKSKSVSGSKEKGRSIALGHERSDVYRLLSGLGIDSDSDLDGSNHQPPAGGEILTKKLSPACVKRGFWDRQISPVQ